MLQTVGQDAERQDLCPCNGLFACLSIGEDAG